jgi:hypothetical protein
MPTGALVLAAHPVSADRFPGAAADSAPVRRLGDDLAVPGDGPGTGPEPGLLDAASAICRDAAARGERLSQRMLARQLRGDGHRFPNEHLRLIAESIGLTQGQAA